MGIKLAIFKNRRGESATVDIGPVLRNIASPSRKWFDPILRATVWRKSGVNCSCMTCGRRLWFWWLSCMKPRCVRSRMDAARVFRGQDWEFEDMVDFDGEGSETRVIVRPEPGESF
jgi:hypothetical protein